MSSNALTPIEQRHVAFYDDQIIAVRVQDGSVYVPIRPICTLLGINWAGQQQRIQRDAVLSDAVRSVFVTHTEPNRTRQIEMLCLPLDYMHGWLFGLNANRVRSELRDRVIRYQKDCYRVLAEAFQQGRVTAAPDDMIDELLHTNSPAAQAYKMVMAMAQMAKQQLLHEAHLKQLDVQVSSNQERLDLIEATLGNKERQITAAQASRLSQAVKTVALELGKHTSRNEFGGVYGEIYRRYNIAGYRELPAAKFDEAMQFLTEWWQSLTDDDSIPF